jgi:putative phosphoribosyl transferase
MKPVFRDRRDAGQALATALLAQVNLGLGRKPVVVALPRGGMPIGFEVAARLSAPLDICVVSRFELPEWGGSLSVALAGGRLFVSDAGGPHTSKISQTALLRIMRRQSREVGRRQQAYRGEHPEIDVGGRTVVLVDDGFAAPQTFRAAVAAVRARAAARVVVAVPVAADACYRQLFNLVDEVVCLEVLNVFREIDASYADFSEVSDLDVRSLHEAARKRSPNAHLD